MFPEKGLGLIEDWIAGGGRGQSCYSPGGRGQVQGGTAGRVRDWKGTSSRVQGSQVPPLDPPPVALPLFPGVRDSWVLRFFCLLSDPNGEKRQHTQNAKMVPGSGDNSGAFFYQCLGHVPVKAYLYTWPQSESSPRDDQTIHKSEPLMERPIQHQIYLHTLKGLKNYKYK